MKKRPKKLPLNGRSRAVKGTDMITYNLVQVPRQLIEVAKAKCRAQDPPVSLRWQLTKLLRDWLELT